MLQAILNKHIVRRLLLTVPLIVLLNICFGQNDSVTIYDKIKHAAAKTKFTTFLYYTIFVDPQPKEYPLRAASHEEKIVNPYLKYKGRIIRKINIKVYDPFNYSVADTSLHENSFLENAGNRLHIKSRHWVIKNKLLFKSGDTLNPLSISETERLLRQPYYINDAKIFLSETGGQDSVDVNVLVQDNWSITLPVILSDVGGKANLGEQNILGIGHQFSQNIAFTKKQIDSYSGYYNIANIDHSFISSLIFYETNKEGTVAGLSFNRPFYSPLAKWAGGASFTRSWKHYNYTDTDNGIEKQLPLNNWGYDTWLGKNLKLKALNKLFDQSTNIAVSSRYYSYMFDKRPDHVPLIKENNPNVSAWLGTVGLSVQQFYKDKYVYRFGNNEDVPHGLILQATVGGLKKELYPIKYYLGLQAIQAKHFNMGYFSTSFLYGMFFNGHIANDITMNYKLDYFSDLIRLDGWYLRGFAKLNVLYAINKLPTEQITFTSEELYGMKSSSMNGNSKMILNLENVMYAPYEIIGFRFAPVLMAGFGLMADKKNKIVNNFLYQSYALGLLVRNEHLLSSTFQVSFGFYPVLPDGQSNVFNYNPITSFTFRINSFSISKPAFIEY
jgi:hypothetical protein